MTQEEQIKDLQNQVAELQQRGITRTSQVMKSTLRDFEIIRQLRERVGYQKGVKFRRGDKVRKTKGSRWSGTVVGEYSTTLTPEGYAVESFAETGSVQIYPAAALELIAALPS